MTSPSQPCSSHSNAANSEEQSVRLLLRGISKRYPAVVANDDISLQVKLGEIHAILGENGAGKSTLMKIIYGATKADSGEMYLNGQRLNLQSPSQARAHGISMVFQHFSLFETLSVAQNVWLGLDKSKSLPAVTQAIRDKAQAYGLDIDPLRSVHSLSVGEMQRVEIIRALLTEPQLLILDEPTSVLTPQAVEKLFVVLRQLASEGCSILYISHKLHEIQALCSACTVLRHGRVTGFCDPKKESSASLSALMIGGNPPTLPVRSGARGAARLKVEALRMPRLDPFGVALEDIHFTLHAGEIVGIAGVSGNGQKELLSLLSGEQLHTNAETLLWFSQDAQASEEGAQPLVKLSPQQRRKLGLYFVPEERLGRAAVPPVSLYRNVLLTRDEAVGSKAGLPWISMNTLQQQAKGIIERFQVKTPSGAVAAQSLSGGNLQKFIVGREIDAAPKVLIVSQPTWGVDVGAAALIRGELLRLREKGCALLIVSEEMDELLELSDTIYVMSQGRMSPPLARADATPTLIGQWMSGLWPQKEREH